MNALIIYLCYLFFWDIYLQGKGKFISVFYCALKEGLVGYLLLVIPVQQVMICERNVIA